MAPEVRQRGGNHQTTLPSEQYTQANGILVCTLGNTWAVIPEALAILAPESLDLYRHHPARATLQAERASRKLPLIGEVWVATTRKGLESLPTLQELWQAVAALPPLRIWTAVDTSELVRTEECDASRELIFRLVFHAVRQVGPENVVLSLAGGRKTMSADLQWAGTIFGCQACLHVFDAQRLPPELLTPSPELFTQPLDAALARYLTWAFTDLFPPSDIVRVRDEQGTLLQPEAYPIHTRLQREDGRVHVYEWRQEGPSLVQELSRREQSKVRLFAGHIQRILEEDSATNWFGLYRLPLAMIDRLRTERLEPRHRSWLCALPKADLHCHLGGILSVDAQKEVARALWEELTEAERTRAEQAVSSWVHQREWPEDWDQKLRSLPNRTEACAAILRRLSVDELSARLFEPTHPRIALKKHHPLGFRAYELPGELSGSALLQREGAIEEYVRQAYRILRDQGIWYCELRASPGKYLRKDIARFLTIFHHALRRVASGDAGPKIRILYVLDRRQSPSQGEIQQAVELARKLDGLIVGFDLAGDESVDPPENLPGILEPAFEGCFPVTIHAGEGETPQRIWESVYRLHAERVGHGLTLHERPDLARRLRDRGIAVELCPASNIEVVGYRDPAIPETDEFPDYPLRSYLRDLHLDVVICTDNPGISRTTLSDELLRAARMAGGLTLWQTLALVRNGFEHAFISADERADLLRRADAEVVRSLEKLP